MFFQLLITIPHTMLWTSAEKLFYENFTILLTVPRIFNARINYLFVNGERIVRILTERQLSTQKFIHDNTQWPQIDMETIAFTSYDFGCHVMGSSNNCSRSVSSFNFQFFCCTHVHQLQVPVCAHHQILRLQISVNDLVWMQMLQDT